jgi:hypothetical protein
LGLGKPQSYRNLERRISVRHVLLSLLLVLVLALPYSAEGQTARSLDLQLQGSIMIANSDHGGNSGSITMRPGWFLTESHEIGLDISGSLNGSKISGDVGPFYSYNFPKHDSRPFIPYLTGGLVTSVGNSSRDQGERITLGPGFRFPLNAQDSFSISAETDYSIKEKKFSDQLRTVVA